MKDAFSNLAQQYVLACNVDYDDPVNFQIVCPCCRTSVFKKSRPTSNGETSYFSHRKKIPGLTADCERRVAGGEWQEEIRRSNDLSRNQSIALFRSVLRDAVCLMPVNGRLLHEKDSSWWPSDELVARSASWLKDSIGDFERVLPQITFSNCVTILQSTGVGVRYGDKVTMKSHIAAALLRTAVADHSPRNLIYLVARAQYASFAKSPNFPHRPEPYGFASKLFDALVITMGRGEKRLADAPAALQEAHTTPLIVMNAILAELERLPFVKMLQNGQLGRRPLCDVTLDDYQPYDPAPEMRIAISDEREDDPHLDEDWEEIEEVEESDEPSGLRP